MQKEKRKRKTPHLLCSKKTKTPHLLHTMRMHAWTLRGGHEAPLAATIHIRPSEAPVSFSISGHYHPVTHWSWMWNQLYHYFSKGKLSYHSTIKIMRKKTLVPRPAYNGAYSHEEIICWLDFIYLSIGKKGFIYHIDIYNASCVVFLRI